MAGGGVELRLGGGHIWVGCAAMRAVVLDRYGGPEVLTVKDVPDPVPGPEEVVVDIVASALNRADLMQREGKYPSPPTPGGLGSFEIPGLEFSGRVAALGERVRLWQPGDAVMAVTGVAGFAERTVAHERMLMPVPRGVDVADAAAIPEAWITAWDALVLQGGLTSGRVALIHAGGSGVGTAGIQIARGIGARSIVTCSASKIDGCLELGAERAVDYRAADFEDAVRDVTGSRGVDVVLDVIGGEYTERNLTALALQGRLVQVGTMGEGRASFSFGLLMSKRAQVIGTVLRSRPIEDKISVVQRFSREILPLFESGVCRPVIDRRYPLEQVGEAQSYLESNKSFGKVLIDIAPRQ
jgi:putative PIG3 family NAD(P)H quinone oxidoreductase